MRIKSNELQNLLQKHEIKSLDQITRLPPQTIFLIIIFGTTSTNIPGDERSQTNPDHDDPENIEIHSDNHVFMFLSQSDWKDVTRMIFEEDVKRTDIIAIESAGLLVPRKDIIMKDI
ncbi:hypothetical protein A2533_00355 [Candidatus Falkowbacteria bacterium RIFOXYD2_FULL_35_9]|uniref:Uncharacterized protein n=1 Tax=Candidatus Falkowbacteria bacterium RIFOXYC2_FULL_36_12 TaxID=1798002 RepID=A0A1F5T038_9BACT|nr:MAG: hypothetical protein A2300_00490 [Candidatus Falkowbacteria bacterium RIFOXYB2_FULL_35_7]OGF32324.1 MAG: hypothetical protein A2478_03310 [Candidatus Falkowbacteria bacterium RIFOXYC2_FULL_36_12]OGF34541.1 MAG: hypothetical protein A2223_00815 [Candidatus Falkowbacteria bacterium RIFOXYA2_FULL_35_8]OGF48420.1 MAG: hypothetical protein A2533_00355 [Candidatus Falkowbacteria bacterium RIFOXYD2_FULL_35_9]